MRAAGSPNASRTSTKTRITAPAKNRRFSALASARRRSRNTCLRCSISSQSIFLLTVSAGTRARKWFK